MTLHSHGNPAIFPHWPHSHHDRWGAFSRRLLTKSGAHGVPCIGGARRAALRTLHAEYTRRKRAFHLHPSTASVESESKKKTYAGASGGWIRGGPVQWVSWANCETVCGMQADDSSPPIPSFPSPRLAEARIGGDRSMWGAHVTGLGQSAIAGPLVESRVPP